MLISELGLPVKINFITIYILGSTGGADFFFLGGGGGFP